MTSLRDFIIGIVLIASFVQIECTLSGELNDYITHVISIFPPITNVKHFNWKFMFKVSDFIFLTKQRVL